MTTAHDDDTRAATVARVERELNRGHALSVVQLFLAMACILALGAVVLYLSF